MSDQGRLDPSEFHVSETHGFLMRNPLEYLPVYFEPWNELAKTMPTLVAQGELRDKVNQMPLLDHRKLEGHRQWRLAHLQLSMIGSGYVWQDGDKGVPKVLPRCLAVPWCEVSRDLGLHPVLCHPSLMLANWKVLDPDQPITPENLKSLYELPGGPEADWFITVTVQIEVDFAKGIKDIVNALLASRTGNHRLVIVSLENITLTIAKMKGSLSKMHERLSADTFYNTLRPFLTGEVPQESLGFSPFELVYGRSVRGPMAILKELWTEDVKDPQVKTVYHWGGNGSPLPEGLVYEGISETPALMIGGSAAQSSTLQSLDAVLGVEHDTEKEDFLKQMRDYMPPQHKCFIETVQKTTAVKQLVDKSSDLPLKSTYNACVAALTDFRSYHIQLVTKYIVLMSRRRNRNTEYEAVAEKGTGGSSVLPFLKSLRDTTTASLINDEFQ